MEENVKEMKIDNLYIKIYRNRLLMGQAAAEAAANKIKILLREQNEVRMVFAAAPSQNELLDKLVNIVGIDWQRITAFHMDEYVGLNVHAPQRFGNYLKERIFEKAPFKKIHYIDTISGDPRQECKHYSRSLNEKPIDIICMGIGENGHIAFNDPPVADFNDPESVKIVDLDQMCRQQQVNDGCFASFDDVPRQAITMTVPMLLSGKNLFVVVPGKTKAQAVYHTLTNEVSTQYPASVLRRHPSATLYLDKDSASEIKL